MGLSAAKSRSSLLNRFACCPIHGLSYLYIPSVIYHLHKNSKECPLYVSIYPFIRYFQNRFIQFKSKGTDFHFRTVYKLGKLQASSKCPGIDPLQAGTANNFFQLTAFFKTIGRDPFQRIRQYNIFQSASGKGISP